MRGFRVPASVRRGWRTPGLRRALVLGVLGTIAFGMTFLAAAWFSVCRNNACPSIEGLDRYDPAQASKVYAADGRLITDLGLERRTVVPLAEMSPVVVRAFLATEDKRFYEHHGIDFVRVFGAIKANVLKLRFAEGFSTITMQLARNLFRDQIDGRDKSLRRKLREAHVALEIERHYPKDKILELYLNQIDLGNRAFGVEAASQRYFGKSVRELNVAEAATLAAIPKAPTTYNPRRNPARSIQRRNVVLGLLRDEGLLADAEVEQWRAYPLLLSSRSDYSGVADYFVEYVRQALQARFGDDLYTAGLRIYTTLDLDMQLAAERALEAQLTAIEQGGARYGKFPHRTYAQYLESRGDNDEGGATVSPYLQGLAVTLEARTGYIRAMVGGRDFDDSKFNRATQSRRQPGSTFKPLVYSAAIEARHPLSEIVDDSPFELQIPDQPLWTPQNYDLKFKGKMTLRQALYDSRNIPAIKVGQEVGEPAVIDEARKFGLTTPILPVPSISIGSADVIPLEMIAAYTVFANQGKRAIPQAILRVEDRNGKILWQPAPRAQEVMDPLSAWLVTDVLRDVVRRGTAAGTVGSKIAFPAGGKTGTTNDGFDVWFIGFTPDLVTGVWMGFDQPKKIMSDAQGGRLAAPAWTAMMNEIYERRPIPAPWVRPDSLVVAEIDETTGFLATPFCPTATKTIEYFLPGTVPAGYCPIHSGILGGGQPIPGVGGQSLGASPAALPGTAPAAAPATPGTVPGRSPPAAATPRTPSRGVMGGAGPPPTR